MDEDNSFFSFSFSLLEFGKSNNKRYQYNIEGLNNNWIEIYDSKIQLNKLPYGDYNLKIKAFLHSYYDNGQILTVPISVPPPFYLTGWFSILTLLCITGLVSLYFKQRTINLKKRQEVLELEIAKANKELSEKYTLISEQKTNLEKINYTKDRIFAIIGHDLRKPAIAFRGITKKINFDSPN